MKIGGLFLAFLLSITYCYGGDSDVKMNLKSSQTLDQFTFSIQRETPVKKYYVKEQNISVKDSTGKDMRVSPYFVQENHHLGNEKKFLATFVTDVNKDELASWIQVSGNISLVGYQGVRTTGAILIPVKVGQEGSEGDIGIKITRITRSIKLKSGCLVWETEEIWNGKIRKYVRKVTDIDFLEGEKMQNLEEALKDEEILEEEYKLWIEPLWKDGTDKLFDALLLSTETGKPVDGFVAISPDKSKLVGGQKAHAYVMIKNKFYDRINFFVRVNTDPVEKKVLINEKIPVTN